jgi:predicted nucleic acid-binding protein
VTFVVDASVTLSWHLDDEPNAYSDKILGRLASESALVPRLWCLEIANGLLIAERRGRITAAHSSHVHQALANLPITADDLSLDLALGSILSVARFQNLSAYDASYLELAMRGGLPLATLDEKLRTAAVAAGVPLAE